MEKMDVNMQSDDPIIVESYHPYHQRYPEGNRKRTPFGFMSCFVLFVAVLLLLGGVALIVIGFLQRDHKIIPLCPHCTEVQIGLCTAGGMFALFGIVGFIASLLRLRVVAVPFMLIALLCGLLLLGGGVFCLVLRFNPDVIDLLDVWEQAVQSSPEFVCHMQQELLGCSGFQLGCCATNRSSVQGTSSSTLIKSFCYINNGNSYDPQEGTNVDVRNRSRVVLWPAKVCPAACPTNATSMCDDALATTISVHLIPVVVVLLGLGLTFIVVGVFSFCMTRQGASCTLCECVNAVVEVCDSCVNS